MNQVPNALSRTTLIKYASPTIRSLTYVLYNNSQEDSDQGLWQFHPDIKVLFFFFTYTVLS